MIAIPGYCTPNVDSWGMTHELEQAALPVDHLSKLHLYTYNACYGASEEFTWQNFLHTGSDLAEELARLVTEVGCVCMQVVNLQLHRITSRSFHKDQ